jgi:type VI secretion system protein VasJ
MAEIDLSALLQDARADFGAVPVNPAPSGADLRGDPEFEWLEDEFRKIETGGPTAVDWKALNARTLAILQGRSKDLVLASRLVYGLHREEGYRGLAVGISILGGMVADHWETMFPPVGRERGRAGTLDWMAEKLAPTIESEPPAEDKKVFALVAHDRLVELDTLLGERLKKFPAAIGPLVRALRPHGREARQALEAKAAAELAAAEAASQPQPEPVAAPAPVAEVPKPVEVPVTAPPPAAPAPAQPTAPMPAIPDIAVGEGAEKALQSLFAAASRVATAVRQEAASDARAYLASRFAIWGQIRITPPDKAGKTALPPPQRAKLAEIQALRSAGNQQGLLMSAESAFVSSPFWLDAQYLVVQSMQALGSDYDHARATVVGQLAAFLKRLPEISRLSFSDGMSFADGETLGWIASEVEAGSGEDGGDGELGNRRAEAGRLGQAGQVVAGLKILTDHAESRHGGRERFAARLEVGEYCLRFDLLQPLLALVESLDSLVEQRSLGVWEPRLAADLAYLSWRALDHKNAKRHMDERQIHERKTRILAALADLDMVMAARLATA